MRIQVIVPITTKEFIQDNKELRIQAGGGLVDIDVVGLSSGPASIENSKDEAMAVVPLIEAAKQAEKNGYDGITIDCAADPGLRAVREAVSIPVCGAGESSYLMAMGLCSHFSVIAVMESTTHIIRENIHKYGLNDRLTSIRYANVPVLELGDGSNSHEIILKEAKLAVEEGAGAVVLGCTGMARDVGKIQASIDVPIIEPGSSAVQFLISILLSGKKTSKKDFPNYT